MKFAALSVAVLVLVGCTSRLDDSSRARVVHARSGLIELVALSCEPKVDLQPFPVSPVSAFVQYPLAMLQQDASGEVLADLSIEADGVVSGVTISKATSEEFRDSVSIGLKRMRFSPAKIHGVSIRVVEEFRILFTPSYE
jgi:TonB family protein